MNIKKFGFTLIELLVVIVIIGILSGIGISQFSAYQSKARDAKRIQQFAQTVRLLKQHVTANQKLPTLTSAIPSACAGWRVANSVHKEKIIEFESDHNYDFNEEYFDECEGFSFYKYPAGRNGCPIEKGAHIVFGATLEQTKNNTKTLQDLSLSEYDFQCPSRVWRVESRFGNGPVFGIFENGDSGSQ